MTPPSVSVPGASDGAQFLRLIADETRWVIVRMLALSDLRAAMRLTRPVGDPAMIVRAAVPLLALDGDDALLAEARAAAGRIASELHDEEARARFLAAPQICALG